MAARSRYEQLPTSHYDSRPPGTVIDTLVIHSMYDPRHGVRSSGKHCKLLLDSHRVSAHYLVDRMGKVWQCVPEEKRAWHAGVSVFPPPYPVRENVNHTSIGVELIGTERSGFTPKQYDALAKLLRDISTRHPIRFIFRHGDIAPDRKDDPWGFKPVLFEHALKKVRGSLSQFSSSLADELEALSKPMSGPSQPSARSTISSKKSSRVQKKSAVKRAVGRKRPVTANKAAVSTKRSPLGRSSGRVRASSTSLR